MKTLPQELLEAWNKRSGPVILSTVDANGAPNAIYATCVGAYGDDGLVVADNYFEKTRANIKAGSAGSILFMTEDNKAYQAKGRIEYHISGPVFDSMKVWNPVQHPGNAAALLRVEAAFSGARQLS
jgi:predicted pyridoxine 5'-phosphate oxidase superfamily flavin-nucleotide-binding protein